MDNLPPHGRWGGIDAAGAQPRRATKKASESEGGIPWGEWDAATRNTAVGG
ncbi:hypothetical protein GCM10022240_11470 [Microbacterium kribbense]|uniref:Uncharacterized protein n=1 Tax=Microbacterium kribbense TaxID=433645 RepID=A0ABP7GAF1_9MICO